MKTPHTLEIIVGQATREYDPITDELIEVGEERIKVPCLFNYVSQAKAFEMYGDRTKRYATCRFMQEIAPFERCFYDGKVFTPVEAIDAPIKHSVRLMEVVE